ncbi:MAG: response regulator [Planctomycetes bacterium]|nr:response regulator [Planctomycetota bacterium]
MLLVGGLLWLLYGVATIGAWVIHPATDSFWNVVLKFNSFWDLCLQVVLGIGLVTIMLDGSHQRMIRALRERDALRERVQQDRKLRALSMLVSGVAHEINNPLTAILGFVDGLADKDPEERRYATRVVREQAQRCRHIVKRLSVLSTTREPQRSPVDVEEFVPRVVRGLEPQFKAAGIELEVGGTSAGCIIHAEAAALEQVLTVLLVNALQATPPGGRVALEVQPSADRVTFVVEDTGPGIAAELRERVFEPFFTTKDREGTGLGLAVARTLVRAHGGRITAEAGAVGARFVIVLPCGEPAVAPAETETEGDPARPTVAGGTRMLVVDDEPLVRASIRRHARALGWQVTEADSGEIALQRLLERHERFDAVACDLRMPGLSGADVYDRIAAEAPELLGRMVFITGDLASDEARRFSERSRAPIFTKPFSFPDLLGCLRERAQHPQVG